MKKYLLAALVVLSASTFAANVTVFGGMNMNGEIEMKDLGETYKYDAEDMGYTVGAEVHKSIAKFEKGNLEFGLGTKYDSTVTANITNVLEGNEELASFMPVYGSLKYSHKINNNVNIYAQGKVGYAFAFDGKFVKDEMNYTDLDLGEKQTAELKGGLYTGIGLGMEIGNYNIGASYDITKSTLKAEWTDLVYDDVEKFEIDNVYSTVALTVGYKFGK